MKTKSYISRTLAMLLMVLATACGSSSSESHFEGSWEGMFMENYPTTLQFECGKQGLSGRVLMFDGESRIQNDELSKIEVRGKKLIFYIPAKETDFEGSVNEDYSKLTGIFIFPDGSEHPFEATLK